MAGKEVSERKEWMFGCPTSKGSLNRAPAEARGEKGKRMSGVLRPCTARHTKQGGGVRAVKRKAEEDAAEVAAPALSPDGVKPAAAASADAMKPAAAAASADLTMKPAAASTVAGEHEGTTEQKWVRMPKAYIDWLLGQTEENHPVHLIEERYDPSMSPEDVERQREIIRKINAGLQAAHDRFFRFQAWVRNKMEINGRVMVPAGSFGPTPEVQQQVEEMWRNGLEEHGYHVNSGSGEFDLPSNWRR